MAARSDEMVAILLVEDEEVALQLLAAILVKKYPDIALHSAENGRAGLELFREHAPDIVITDVNMPEMNGTQMAGQIRSLNPRTRIITLSAGNGDLLPRTGEPEFETDYYIFKPINFAVLFAALEECFAAILLAKGAPADRSAASAR
jgi:YesN/AraC family two-component response regulator